MVQADKLLGYIAVGDKIKPSAFKLIKQVKAMNITPVMLTGDNKKAAQGVANKLGITEIRAELMLLINKKLLVNCKSKVRK